MSGEDVTKLVSEFSHLRFTISLVGLAIVVAIVGLTFATLKKKGR